nr:alcohol dehydrogenase catalytic domain-containing protein [Nitrosopumilus sp.]
MKALIFDKPGIDNLRFGDYPLTEPQENEVIVETKCIGINPIDYFTITGFHGTNGPTMKINPFPHIAGSEIAGTIIRKGNKTKDSLKEGDRVIIYNRIFDNTCKLCKKGYEMLCQNGGLVGVAINGGFAEYVKISDENIIKIPDNISWELAASLPVAGLTAFHAIKESNVIPGENMIIFGASGNTGHFCTQIGKILGARIIAISKKQWVKEYGADEVVSFDN